MADQFSTESRVLTLLDEIARDNKPIPTIRKIRDTIGGGSLSTINKAVYDWKVANASKLADASEFPAELTGTISKSIMFHVWKSLRPLLVKRIGDLKRLHQTEIDRMQARLDEYKNLDRDYKQALFEVKKENARLKEKVTALEAELEQLRKKGLP